MLWHFLNQPLCCAPFYFPVQLKGQLHQGVSHWTYSCSKNILEAHLYKNTAKMNFLLFPQQQNRKNVVSSKALLLLNLIGCLNQKWHWQAVQLCTLSWKVKIILTHMHAQKLVAHQQERSTWLACCTIVKQWFCWPCFSSNTSWCDRLFRLHQLLCGKCYNMKNIYIFPNCKPWMNSNGQNLLKSLDNVFHTGDLGSHKTARTNLRKGIKKARHCYKSRKTEHFNTQDSQQMWQGIKSLQRVQHLPDA